MSTTRARSRARRAASSTGPLVSPPAARKTWSAPRPPVAVRTDLLDVRRALGVRRGAARAPACLGEPAALLDGVDADDPHPGGDEQPHDELADEPEADDARHLAELRLAAAHALHGDGADGGERRVLRGDALGHRARTG